MTMPFRGYCVGLLMAAAAGSLTAGTLLTVRIETGRGGSILTHEIRVEGQRLRMDTLAADAQQTVLYNNETQSLFVVNEQKKIFRRVRHEDAENSRKQQAAKQEEYWARMEQRMRNLPPEKQAPLRMLLRQRSGAAADAALMECRRAEEGRTVGSWSSDYYECFVGSRRVREVWSVPWESTGLSSAEAEVLKEFIRRRGSASTSPGPGAGSGGFPIASDAFPGLAVQSMEVRGDGVQRGHEVSSIERKEFESSLFFVDGSYTEAATDRFMVPIR